MSNKTWQDRFDERFPHIIKNLLDEELRKYPNLTNEFWEAIKQFISDLRKRDMEAMLKITDDYYDGEGIEDWNKRLQLIKDHYEN